VAAVPSGLRLTPRTIKKLKNIYVLLYVSIHIVIGLTQGVDKNIYVNKRTLSQYEMV
jgi:hypothetical protein